MKSPRNITSDYEDYAIMNVCSKAERMTRKVLIIGLDGATFALIRPWAAYGKLPNLAAFLKDGTHGDLKSTMPPMTPPAWNSFMTGKNPGKHGVYGFTEHKANTYEIQFTSALQRKTKTLWKLLSEAGGKVGVVGVPTTYPPESVNGIMISGFDAPVASDKSMYPPGLYKELVGMIGEYIIAPNIVKFIDKDRIDEALKVILHSIDNQTAAAKYLLKRKPWDLFMIVFGQTDKASHHFWKFHDKNSPHYRTYEPRQPFDGTNPLLTVYEKLDQVIGDLTHLVPEDTTIILVSDHGSGGTSDKVIYVNRWLNTKGFLNFKTSSFGSGLLINKFLRSVKEWSMRVVPTNIRRHLRYRTRLGLGTKLESMLRFSSIDWKRTKAYFEETPYYPNIWINLMGREPQGAVEPAKYKDVREEITRELYDWKDPETGKAVVDKVYKREEIFHGNYVYKAPDLIVSFALDEGYSYLSRSSRASPNTTCPLTRIKKDEISSSKFLMNRSGSHREEGIFMIRGGMIKKNNQIKNAEIIDLAPTILYLLGVPLLEDMDGRILNEVFKDDFLEANTPAYQGERDDAKGNQDDAYSIDEAEKIHERLRGLGYLE